jgi:hypothetical protein
MDSSVVEDFEIFLRFSRDKQELPGTEIGHRFSTGSDNFTLLHTTQPGHEELFTREKHGRGWNRQFASNWCRK